MRLTQFTDQPITTPSKLSLYSWTIHIHGESESRLSPFGINDIELEFPGLDIAIGSVYNVELRDHEKDGQIVDCDVDVALWADREETGIKILETQVFVYVQGNGAQLFLGDPTITIVG